MKSYNLDNYLRYKEDVKNSKPEGLFWDEYKQEDIIKKFLPMVENLARKFATGDQASGIMNIEDLIQEGSIGLIAAVNKLDINTVIESDNPEQTIKSFLSKRIKGAIRRAININRGSMRIPEYKLNEIRRETDDESDLVMQFFNQIFSSIDAPKKSDNADSNYSLASEYAIPDEPYNIIIYNKFLLGIMKKHLSAVMYDILRHSYGLDCNKLTAKEIALRLDLKGVSNHVRISEMKRAAIDILKKNVKYEELASLL
jgi:RNA polymerase sigma factor (sigma-70 family)